MPRTRLRSPAKKGEIAMSISGKTAMLAIIGDPIAHVRAPDFYNPQFFARGIDAFIVPMHLLRDDLPDVLPRLHKLRNFHGLVVTIPHKETIARLCDVLQPAAQLADAVNVVRFDLDG